MAEDFFPVVALYLNMIMSFKTPDLEFCFKNNHTGGKIPPDLAKRILRQLLAIDVAMDVNDLRIPPGNHLELLKGDREGQYSIRENKQYRLCFHFIDGNAFNVELADYL